MNPNGGSFGLRKQVRWNLSETLGKPLAIFAVAKHLDQPVREANDEEGHQQRAVEEVHGGESILTAQWAGFGVWGREAHR